jgi:hypothetical protein
MSKLTKMKFPVILNPMREKGIGSSPHQAEANRTPPSPEGVYPPKAGFSPAPLPGRKAFFFKDMRHPYRLLMKRCAWFAACLINI